MAHHNVGIVASHECDKRDEHLALRLAALQRDILAKFHVYMCDKHIEACGATCVSVLLAWDQRYNEYFPDYFRTMMCSMGYRAAPGEVMSSEKTSGEHIIDGQASLVNSHCNSNTTQNARTQTQHKNTKHHRYAHTSTVYFPHHIPLLKNNTLNTRRVLD